MQLLLHAGVVQFFRCLFKEFEAGSFCGISVMGNLKS